ncbi:MAG: biopolymer transporter ExbD [Verrucomicrobiota bacterium]
MKFSNHLQPKKARIEIIPLIDVMFFLLASFIMVSLQMQKLQSLHMDLPSAVAASRDRKPDILNVDVDKSGDIQVEGKRLNLIELEELVKARLKVNERIPVYLRAASESKHGRILEILDAVRAVGAIKVSFAIDPPRDGA